MTYVKTFVCTIIISIVIVSDVFSATNKVVDDLISKKINPSEYINTKEFVNNRNAIKEEVLEKLTQMIEEDKYQDLLYLIPFVVEISDQRYIEIMNRIEKNVGTIAGVNIKGYSEFIKLKNVKANNSKIVEQLLKPNIGSYLFSDVSSFIMKRSGSINDKLKYFRIMAGKVDYRYPDVIYNELLEHLCKENSEVTNIFIRADRTLSTQLEYDCDNLHEAP